MVSAVICMSLRRIWHLCNLPCVYALFWRISIQRYAFKSPQICFWGTKYEFYREHVANLHYIVRRARLWLELFASTLGRSLSDIIFQTETIIYFQHHKLLDVTEHDLCRFFVEVPSLPFFLGGWVRLHVGYGEYRYTSSHLPRFMFII